MNVHVGCTALLAPNVCADAFHHGDFQAVVIHLLLTESDFAMLASFKPKRYIEHRVQMYCFGFSEP